MRSASTVVLLLLAAALLPACAIGRVYAGQELPADATARIEAGRSTVADVLEILGPPDRILRTARGDVFTWRFRRTNSSSFTLEEPVLTNLELFSWSKVQEKSDAIAVFFDREGVVSALGYRRGTDELEPL